MLHFVAGLQAFLEPISPDIGKKPGRDLVLPPLPCLSCTRVPGQGALCEGGVCLSEEFSISRHGEAQDWVRERNGVSKGLSVAAALCRGNAPGAVAVLEPGGCAGGGFRACLLCSLGALGTEHPCPLCPHVPELPAPPPTPRHITAVPMAVLGPARMPSCPGNGGNSLSGTGDPPVSVSPWPSRSERGEGC